jgi:cyclopropane fatty-acyl-phospholipid synthase-like methyltransferase
MPDCAPNQNQIIEEMQGYYHLRAEVYDASMGYDNPEAVDRHAEVIAELRRIATGRSVLELACGPCFWTQQIADVAQRITATDFNESALAEARKKSLPWERVTLLQADAYHPGTIPGDFDMVLAVDWFAHVPKSEIPQFLDGLASRVPEGSHVVFIDQTPGENSLTGLIDEEGNHYQERILTGDRKFRVIKHFFSDEEYHACVGARLRGLSIRIFPACRRILVHGISKRK